MESRPLDNIKNSRRAFIFAGFFILAVATIGALYQTLLLPFLIAAFFAYLLLPLADMVEKRFKIDRTYAALIVVGAVVGMITLAIFGLVPVVKHQILAIISMVPAAKAYVIEKWLPMIRDLLVATNLTDYTDFNKVITKLNLDNQMRQPAMEVMKELGIRGFGVLGGVIDLTLIPVIAFFLMKDFDLIKAWMARITPPDLYPSAINLKNQIDKTLRSILKGQVTVASILAVLYVAGFSLVGVPYAVTIGVIAGICRMVPYLDVIVGVLLCVLVIMTDPGYFTWSLPIGIAIVFAVVQTLDGMFITPRVIGEKVGLHAGIVIASIIAFGSWWGFWGVLLAIPLVAVAKILLLCLYNAYVDSRFYHNR